MTRGGERGEMGIVPTREKAVVLWEPLMSSRAVPPKYTSTGSKTVRAVQEVYRDTIVVQMM